LREKFSLTLPLDVKGMGKNEQASGPFLCFSSIPDSLSALLHIVMMPLVGRPETWTERTQ
jgi:hypothetical protein